MPRAASVENAEGIQSVFGDKFKRILIGYGNVSIDKKIWPLVEETILEDKNSLDIWKMCFDRQGKSNRSFLANLFWLAMSDDLFMQPPEKKLVNKAHGIVAGIFGPGFQGTVYARALLEAELSAGGQDDRAVIQIASLIYYLLVKTTGNWFIEVLDED